MGRCRNGAAVREPTKEELRSSILAYDSSEMPSEKLRALAPIVADSHIPMVCICGSRYCAGLFEEVSVEA